MASIIPSFEYDIFISYRQKDNKHDGWVTEFVDNLKGELEATFKEDISIYFDENPHDGLLETHSVDKSLEGKLKCLIFIPIISQTYCDSKSFAWQLEFCAFNKLAKEDKFGRDIKLSSGNVASRILPVKIHDLDPEDKALLENELGGVLRSIEFIYKSAGVNRPLRGNEDHPQDNLNKTYYRDQINKVANAVKEIIAALRVHGQQAREERGVGVNAKPEKHKNLKLKIIAGSAILLMLSVLGIFFIPKFIKPTKQLEKSIAVLPFRNDSPDSTNKYFIDGTMEAILDNLCKIADLTVISRTSVEQFRNTTKPVREIAKLLNVNYILEGSGQKYGNEIRLTVQLIDAVNDKHLWSSPYEGVTDNIFKLQSQIAQTIARNLEAILTPDEKKLIEKVPTQNMTAYDLYLRAKEYENEYWTTLDSISYHKSATLYKTIIELDPTFAKAYSGLARANYDRYYKETYFSENFLDSCLILAKKALSLDNALDEAYFLLSRYFYANGQMDEALDNIDKTLIINPNNYSAFALKGSILTSFQHDYIEGINNYNKALVLIRGEERPYLLREVGLSYQSVGFLEKAKSYYQEAFDLDNNELYTYWFFAWIEFCNENFEGAYKLIKEREKIDSANYAEGIIPIYNFRFGHEKEAYLFANKLIEYYKKSGRLNLSELNEIGYAFWQVGKHEEAKSYFIQQIKFSEESIKLGRNSAQTKSAQFTLALTYAFLGDKDKAYHYLDEANKSEFHSLLRIIVNKHHPMFKSIRNEERFQKILQDMEAKYKAEHERVKNWLEEQEML